MEFWSSLLGALVGGSFALGGVVLQQRLAERTQREARLDELVERTRALGMEASSAIKELRGDDFARLGPQLQRALISLQVHGKRWQHRSDESHQGFAATIHELSGRLSAVVGVDWNSRASRDAYVKALDAVVLACVAWEQEPGRFAKGPIPDEF